MKRRKFGGAALLLAVMFIIALFAGASGVAASEEPPPPIEGGAPVEASNLTELLNAIQSATGQTTINLTAGITVSQEALNAVPEAYPDYVLGTTLKLFSEHNITIKSSGAIGAMFTVESGYSLELGKADGTGGQLILDGNKSSASAAGALLDIYGTVVLNSGSVLQNNNNASIDGLGGGAVIRSGGVLTINETINTSGVINNCQATYGGGIYIESGDNPATLNITGGADLSEFVMLRQNTAITDGAGIFAAGSNALIFLDRNVGFSANDTVYLASGAILTLKPGFNSESGKIPLKAAGENTLGTIVAQQEKAEYAAYNTNICFTPNTELGDEKFYSIAAKESENKLSTEWYIDWTYVTLTLQAEPLIGQSFPTDQCLVYNIDRYNDAEAYHHTVCIETRTGKTTSVSSLKVYGIRAGYYSIAQTNWSYRLEIKNIRGVLLDSNFPNRLAKIKITADSSVSFVNSFVAGDACMAFESKKILNFTKKPNPQGGK